jgi:Fic family protein
MRRTTGHYATGSVTGETVRAFIPDPLPPDPPLELQAEDQDLLERTNRALGELVGAIPVLDIPLLTYMYVRKEAVLSSQIEGTQSSLADLLLHETEGNPGVPIDDVEEVVAYVSAMKEGLRRIQDGFPISNRLIRDLHRILLSTGRGREKQPGEFRRSQNRIGGTRSGNAHYVPPPPEKVEDCMSELERFIHDMPKRTSPILKSALTHMQFESIHPFLDGNGRIGRLLITLILCSEGVLPEPVLYLSLYFKQNRTQYYAMLDRVRTDGDWESWVRFFLQGVSETSLKAVAAANEIRTLIARDEERLSALKRVSGSALSIHRILCASPILSIREAAEKSGLAFQTAMTTLDRLTGIGITRELTGRQRDRRYAYSAYLEILNRGTEPLNA